MLEALQGFQPDRLMTVVWTFLAGWLVWPIVCGLIGLNRGQAMKCAMHGLCWGPIGLLVVLMAKRKYECPTCGHATLDQPACELTEAWRQRASDAAARNVPMPLAAPEPAMSTAADVLPLVNDASSVPTEPGKIIEDACAGYSEEEAARLLAWVNAQRNRLQGTRDAVPAT